MAGAGLIAIKRRIKSVTNTRKITKAMGLVATAKLRKSRDKLIVSEHYHKAMDEILQGLLEEFEGDSAYTLGNKSSKKLYIVFTSDTGLCGAFNGSVINKALEAIKGNKEESLIMVVGQKGKMTFNRLKYETAAEYVEVPDIPTIKEAKIIALEASNLFVTGVVSEVYVVYTEFVSAVKLSPVIKKILPVKPIVTVPNSISFFEPKVEKIFDQFIEIYMKEFILHCMLNSKASEHSSRMNAMDGATKNANDLLNKLNLSYNRIRQSTITQEISEIVGGAEAQR